MPIGVNLTSNPVTECCLTVKPRSPLAPLKKGGTRTYSKSPFPHPPLGGAGGGGGARGGWGFRGIWTMVKTTFIKAETLEKYGFYPKSRSP